jgi:hypothetical protein
MRGMTANRWRYLLHNNVGIVKNSCQKMTGISARIEANFLFRLYTSLSLYFGDDAVYSYYYLVLISCANIK